MSPTTAIQINPAFLQVFFRRMERRDELGPEEREALAAAFLRERAAPAGSELVSEGERPSASTLLVSGFAARTSVVKTGERQITAFHVPGDFIDLHSFLIKEMDHAVVALTPVTIAQVPHAAIERLTERFPHLTRLLWLMTLLDGAVHREWLVGLGRLSALARAAHLFCELGLRLEAVGVGSAREFEFPVTQSDLADAMGLSAVHMNRVIQELRARGLLAWQGAGVVLPDLEGLRALAEFDPRYLHLTREPR